MQGDCGQDVQEAVTCRAYTRVAPAGPAHVPYLRAEKYSSAVVHASFNDGEVGAPDPADTETAAPLLSPPWEETRIVQHALFGPPGVVTYLWTRLKMGQNESGSVLEKQAARERKKQQAAGRQEEEEGGAKKTRSEAEESLINFARPKSVGPPRQAAVHTHGLRTGAAGAQAENEAVRRRRWRRRRDGKGSSFGRYGR